MHPEVPEKLRLILAGLPASPGVYIMRDANRRPLYVGKAKSLRARVRSYFQLSGDGRLATTMVARHTTDIDVVLTDTEKEALILENNLIKKLRPRYNISLRDDKAYLCVRVAVTDQFPRLQMVRRIRQDRALYFGPYSRAGSIRETVHLLASSFGLRVCKDSELRNRTRPCALHEMGYCTAPCVGIISQEDYHSRVQQALRFLRGDTAVLVDRLTQEMESASVAMDYERARVLRDRIQSIAASVEGQKMVFSDGGDLDVLGLHRDGDSAVVQVLHVREGQVALEGSYHLPRCMPDDGILLGEFLSRFYGPHRFVPPAIHLPAALDEDAGLHSWLRDLRNGAVHLHVPVRGPKRRLVELASRNAAQNMSAHSAHARAEADALEELGQGLGLPAPPQRIDCFDVANLQGQETVAAMAVLIAGQPASNLYRHYRVRSLAAGVQNDIAALAEVTRRRYLNAGTDGSRPDLVLIDGGRGQLASVSAELQDLGLQELPVFAIAKGRGREGGDRIYSPGAEAPLDTLEARSLRLLMRARDEAHRFANRYHRNVRRRGRLASGLEEIPGIGPRTIARVTRHFPTLDEIKAASLEDLQHRSGVTARQAGLIHAHFHPSAGSGPSRP